ncbi:FAD/NAD(P)-binding oxidoreductase [Kaistia sp. 32K]|uniref:NAD(P)/FAD-dependent oxidoreductase n=1 Tax=Kaistia sp. 32K TaxID=2795690 RepID=UPI0019371578|nr:NAD(P)/FAD-dependent oxidoreductase [Kaistia sp. 32K]BCP55251.1 FAD/NAD(P)-binding oxidoreductase [Kaistia sp. 32K]
MFCSNSYDVAIIGGGVVGCALARRFSLQGAQVILLEKGRDILVGASKGNSGLLHTGFDAPSGSLELKCVQAGYREYMEIREELALPVLRTDAVMVAWTEADEAKLVGIAQKGRENGVDVAPLTATEVLEHEPHLDHSLRAGLLVRGEHVVDPWSAPLAYVRQAIGLGAHVVFNAEVTGGSFDGTWTLSTKQGEVRANAVVNAAGLFGDQVERLLLGESSFMIKPRKGQFVVFDKAAARYLRGIVLPVPSERTKGVVLAPTIFGNVLIGPTAEEQDERDRATVTQDALETLIDRAVAMLPPLKDMPVTATYAGLRPASERSEYRVSCRPADKWITIGGIRSTGLTSALGLAQHAYELYQTFGPAHTPPAHSCAPKMLNLAEHAPRDWALAGGEIVCHCELVTRREIELALASNPAPNDLTGLKRRTRVTMGRCQGFYCMGRLAELTEGRLENTVSIGAVK